MMRLLSIRPTLLLPTLALGLFLLAPGAARAALDIGDPVPPFTAPAAQGGNPFQYELAKALAKGPVVVYFFPAAFSVDCSIEAHTFADAIPQFEALGASVVGVSTDSPATLSRFSSQACQGKFPVASDESAGISRAFDAIMQTQPAYANRISYLIAPGGTVAAYYLNLNPAKHVEKMLEALKLMNALKAAAK